MNPVLDGFLCGAIAMACWAAGLFFLKWWSATRDRLFLYFCLGFWVFSLGWISRGLIHLGDESRHYLYVIRLVAFSLIIAGIVDKNRRKI